MNIRFILVEPKVPENIGASARAMKTMGYESLILVNPKCSLTDKALWVAHGSGEIVSEATVFETLPAALAGSDFSVATTAKARSVRRDPVPVEELGNFLGMRRMPGETVSIVFGREESGLTNEEIAICDISSYITMKQQFPSLNLSQAVMLYAYELAGLQRVADEGGNIAAKGESLRILKDVTSSLLVDLGIPEEGALFGRIMERLSHLSPSDARLLLSVTKRISKRLHPRLGDELIPPSSDDTQSQPNTYFQL